jgi:hypothetical protein
VTRNSSVHHNAIPPYTEPRHGRVEQVSPVALIMTASCTMSDVTCGDLLPHRSVVEMLRGTLVVVREAAFHHLANPVFRNFSVQPALLKEKVSPSIVTFVNRHHQTIRSGVVLQTHPHAHSVAALGLFERGLHTHRRVVVLSHAKKLGEQVLNSHAAVPVAQQLHRERIAEMVAKSPIA